MAHTSLRAGIAACALLVGLASTAAERPVGSISSRPTVPLDSQAMNAMLRADRDKDGTLSREELDHYDLGLARRFKEVDADRDGKLTLYEFEKLLSPSETVSGR